MAYVFNNETPIYLQIVDLIINDIINGSLKPNDKLLSVREYSNVFKVNPNTIVKALAMLEDDKLIYTERTNGKFVTSDLDIINKYRANTYKSKIESFINEMEAMGLDKESVINMIKEMK